MAAAAESDTEMMKTVKTMFERAQGADSILSQLPKTNKKIQEMVLGLSVLPCALGRINYQIEDDETFTLVMKAYHSYLTERFAANPRELTSLFLKAIFKPSRTAVPTRCVIPLIDQACHAFGLVAGATTGLASAVALKTYIAGVFNAILTSGAPIIGILTELMAIVNGTATLDSVANGPVKDVLVTALPILRSVTFDLTAVALVVYGAVCMLRSTDTGRARFQGVAGNAAAGGLFSDISIMGILKWFFCAPEFIVMGCCGDNPLRSVPDDVDALADRVCFNCLNQLANVINKKHGSTVAQFLQQEHLLSNFSEAFNENGQMDPIAFNTLSSTLRSVEHACVMDELKKLVQATSNTAQGFLDQYMRCKVMLEMVFPDLRGRFITEANITAACADRVGVTPVPKKLLGDGGDSQGTDWSKATEGSDLAEAFVRRHLEVGPTDREVIIRLWLSTVECLLTTLKHASKTLNTTLLEITKLFFKDNWSGDEQHETVAKQYTPVQQAQINRGQHPVFVLKTILRTLGSEASMNRLLDEGFFGRGLNDQAREMKKCLFRDSIFRVWTLLSKCYQPTFNDHGELVYSLPPGEALDDNVEMFKKHLETLHKARDADRINTSYTLMDLVMGICDKFVPSFFKRQSSPGADASAVGDAPSTDEEVLVLEEEAITGVVNAAITDRALIGRLSSQGRTPAVTPVVTPDAAAAAAASHGAILKLVTGGDVLSQGVETSTLPKMLDSTSLALSCVLPENIVGPDASIPAAPGSSQDLGEEKEDVGPISVAVDAVKAVAVKEDEMGGKRDASQAHGGKSRSRRRRPATAKRTHRKAYNKKSNKRKSGKQSSRRRQSRRRQSRRK